jgi:hypothetical protein
MRLREIRANTCNCILIVATLRRQPISADGGDMSEFGAAQCVRLTAGNDGAGPAVMEICRIFESRSWNALLATIENLR